MSENKNSEPKPYIAFDGVTQGRVQVDKAGHTESFPTSPDGIIGGLPRP